MNRSDLNKNPWLPNVIRQPNSSAIWVEQPDGSYIECDPIRFSIYIKELVSALTGAAYSKLAVVKPECRIVSEPHDDLTNFDPE